jgi:hypothetical protein
MVPEDKPSGEDGRIPWHPAFFHAVKLELEQYKDALEFTSEFQLAAEPLKIDVVIIKKAPGVVIDKNIARIFRRVNIMEYKSPEDYVSVQDFYKALGYAALYAALNKADMRDMTVSLVGTRHPKELFKYIAEEEGGAVAEDSPGINRITGYWLPIQVIESGKLPLEENVWLKGLNKGLNVETTRIILEEGQKKRTDPEIAAYLYAVLQANAKTIREVLNMDSTEEITLDEVLEEAGLTAKWEARGEARGVVIGEARGVARGEKTAWEKFVSLMRQGYTADELERMSPTGVPPSA